MFCPQCGTNNPDGTHFCSNCGSALAGQQGAPGGFTPPAAQPPAAAPPAVTPPAAAPPAGGYTGAPGSYAPGPPQGQGFGSAVGGGYQTGPAGAPVHSAVSVDFRRLGTGDLVAAGGTILLFISLFLAWYSVTGQDPNTGLTITITNSALGQYAGGFRFLVLVLAIFVFLYLLARTFAPRGFRLPLPHWQILSILVGLQLLLTILTFFLKPSDQGGPGVSWSYGAYIGLVASLIAMAGAVLRKNEPEVIVPGAPRGGFGGGFGGVRAGAAPTQMGGGPAMGPSRRDLRPVRHGGCARYSVLHYLRGANYGPNAGSSWYKNRRLVYARCSLEIKECAPEIGPPAETTPLAEVSTDHAAELSRPCTSAATWSAADRAQRVPRGPTQKVA